LHSVTLITQATLETLLRDLCTNKVPVYVKLMLLLMKGKLHLSEWNSNLRRWTSPN